MSLPSPCAGFIDSGGVVEVELNVSPVSVTAVPAEINKVEPTL